MIDALEIGYAVKDRRAQLGMTQAQVAEAAGVSKRSLWSIELGRNTGVQLDKLIAVLKVLGLDLTIAEAPSASDAKRSIASSTVTEAVHSAIASETIESASADAPADSSMVTIRPSSQKSPLSEHPCPIDALAILTGRA